MSIKKYLKKLAGYRCQICGDKKGKIYPDFRKGEKVEIQVHHIVPKSKGGKTTQKNLIVLCDLCHAVMHKQRWHEYFGSKRIVENMEWIKKEFEDYMKFPPKIREKIKRELRQSWGSKVIRTQSK